MSYQTAKTIAEVLSSIEKRRYVLPAIQREFVWSREQIEELFDSLMRGYPIGSFLFWEISDPKASGYEFYDFVADYDPRQPHNDPANLMGSASVEAILDGQQRLSALNIALRGSFTEKTPRLKWNNPKAFVKRRLHLCLLHQHDDAAPDEAMYEFSFKSLAEQVAENEAGDHYWLPVANALSFDPNSLDHEQPLVEAGIDDNKTARLNAHRLTQLIHKEGIISYYLEREDDLDKVLNIFIRVNRGGTKLSYSDLLMSVATAHWKGDARQQVHDLVDSVNAIGDGFAFSRDRMLKAALVLSDLPDIRLKAKNMLDSMLTVEENWDDIADSVTVAAALLASFGLSRDTLTAENVLIPLAYYVHRHSLDMGFVAKPKHADNRDTIRSWVVRTLLRSGFWTGAVDTILLETRRVMQEQHSKGVEPFPVKAIEEALEAKNKSLKFTEGEIEDLLAISYKRPRSVPLLTLLYGSAVTRSAFHVDHVYTRAKLRRKAMAAALDKDGRPESELDDWMSKVDQLPNLQLLTAAENIAKGDLTPNDWAETIPATARKTRLTEADLSPLPTKPEKFFDWWEKRRDNQEQRIRKVLDVAVDEAEDD